ncbi:hypothetical protein BKI52_44940 [marine bacterium AO1-C]|nr:hypothetical protein BKI52_44940 [marine bacterium AO1-C]
MSKIIQTKLGQIEYSIIGQGKPVVFLHGGHSNCNETLFYKGYDTTHFQLITPSRPGYGQTPLNGHKQPKEAAKLIEAMLDQLGIHQIIVVGISAGGLTALELAANFPEKVTQLILISAVTKKWLTPQDKTYKRASKMFSPKREKMSWKLFRTFFTVFPRQMTKVLFKELSSQKGQKITREEIAAIKEMTFKQSAGEGFITDLEQDIVPELITKIKCPTLIMHSKNDQSVNIAMAHHAHEKIKHSELKVYDNKWGHLLWVGEDNRQPINDLNDFLIKYNTEEKSS